MKPYLSPAECARELGISVDLVSDLINEGVIPAVRISPRKVIVPRVELDNYLTERARQEAAERREAREKRG